MSKIEKIEINQSNANIHGNASGVDLKNSNIGELNLKQATNKKFGQVTNQFWAVRQQLKTVVFVSIFIVAAIHLVFGVIWIDKPSAIQNLLAGFVVLIVSILYLLIWRADKKDKTHGFKVFWLTLDLLFLGIVFWVLL